MDKELNNQQSVEQPIEVVNRERHPFYDKIKSYYPGDEDYGDDDNKYYDKAIGKIDELEKYKNDNEQSSQEMLSIVEDEPLLGAIITDLSKGATLIQALSKYFDPEDLIAQDGDEDYDEWSKNRKRRSDERKANDEFGKEVSKNIEQSQADIRAFADESGMDDDKLQEFLTNVNSVLEDAYKGRVSKDFLARMYTAENHTKEVEKAKENALIEGRNENIEATLKKDGEKKKGSGLPNIKPAERKMDTHQMKEKTIGHKFLEGTGLI